MKIRAGYRIALDVAAPTAILLKLGVHPDRRGDLLTPDDVQLSSGSPIAEHLDEFGNLVRRLTAPAGRIVFSSDFVVADSGAPDVQNWTGAKCRWGTCRPTPCRSCSGAAIAKPT
jgi:hypothetical protein